MKTYSGSERAKDEKKNKIIAWVVAIVSVLVIAATITLAVVFTRGGNVDVPIDAPVDDPTPEQPPDNPVTPPHNDAEADVMKFGLPIENGNVIRESSLASLVYMPSLNMWKTHNGVDFAATENAPVLSIADGKVTGVEQTTLEGVVVTIDHGEGIVSVYKSLASASVNIGDEVRLGGEIGKAGTMLTENSDGFHVHLEMTVNGTLTDPLEYVGAEINK